VKLDKSQGDFTTEQRLWMSIDWDRAPKGLNIRAAVEFASNGGNRRVVVPVFNPEPPTRDAVTGFVEDDGCVSIEAEHFTRKRDRSDAAWEIIKGLGRSGDSVAVFPPTTPSRTGVSDITAHSPALEYDLYLFGAGEATLSLDCLPTKPITPQQGTRVAVSLDDGAPEVLAGRGGDVLANLRRLTTKMRIPKPGPHKLVLWMVDPGVVVDKLALEFQPPPESYLGPPESWCAGQTRPEL
jgi:hypothetical protein